jgi:tetratricopeptide (TPR) repeat protein
MRRNVFFSMPILGLRHLGLWGALVLVIVALPLLPSTSRGEGTDWAQVHAETIKGINYLYNLDIRRASAAFDSVSRMAPDDPRGPFFQSILHFFMYGLTRSETEFNDFFTQSDRVIEICSRLLDKNEKDATAKFYLGGIYGYRGLAYQLDNSMLRAVQAGRKGFAYLEEAVQTDSTLYDAQMGFGLFRYLVAKVPREYRWVLNLLGFSGDLEGGLNSLRLAAEKGVYTRTEAKLYLYQFLLTEHKTDEAVKYMKELLHDYPDNTLFAVLYSSFLMRSENFDEAMVWAKKAEEINSRKAVKYGEEFIYSTLGGIYYIRSDFLRARQNYDLFVQKVQNKNYISNYIAYRYAVSCELTGEHAKAAEICSQMHETGSSNREWDRYYYRRGQDLALHGLSGAESLSVKAGNALALKQYDRALELNREALQAAGSDPDQEGLALYGILQADYEREKDSSVVEIFGRLRALLIKRERWVLPHGYYRLGLSLRRLGRVAEARSAFQTALTFDDYDFQRSLEHRVEEALKALESAPSSSAG